MLSKEQSRKMPSKFLALLCVALALTVANALEVPEDDCENRVFTNNSPTTLKSRITCNGETFQRNAGVLAAYECCAKRKQNSHCRSVCHLRAQKVLKSDGSWNRGQIIRRFLTDFGDNLGPDFAMEALDCLQRFGRYNASVPNCHHIERHMTCLRDFIFRNCRQSTEQLINTYYGGDEAIFKCKGRANFMPTLVLEDANLCREKANSTYGFLKCMWRQQGILNEDNTVNRAVATNWRKLLLGTVHGNLLTELTAEAIAPFDTAKLWAQVGEETEINAMADYMAALKEVYFQGCGEVTNNFIHTM